MITKRQITGEPLAVEDRDASGLAPSFPRHYSFPEIAAMWRMSQNTVRRLFCSEPGVVWISNPRSSRGKRAGRNYRTGRVPEPVLLRVYRRISAA
jgi:hypothetical protein